MMSKTGDFPFHLSHQEEEEEEEEEP